MLTYEGEKVGYNSEQLGLNNFRSRELWA